MAGLGTSLPGQSHLGVLELVLVRVLEQATVRSAEPLPCILKLLVHEAVYGGTQGGRHQSVVIRHRSGHHGGWRMVARGRGGVTTLYSLTLAHAHEEVRYAVLRGVMGGSHGGGHSHTWRARME